MMNRKAQPLSLKVRLNEERPKAPKAKTCSRCSRRPIFTHDGEWFCFSCVNAAKTAPKKTWSAAEVS